MLHHSKTCVFKDPPKDSVIVFFSKLMQYLFVFVYISYFLYVIQNMF